MQIVPGGTRRQMQAQVSLDYSAGLDPQMFNNQINQPVESPSAGDSLSTDTNQLPNSDILDKNKAQIDQNLQQQEKRPETETGNSMRSFVFKKLESFGYPPRRLQEFEDDFVDEKFFPGGVREVSLVIPDRHYGKNEELSGEEVNQFVKEIQEKFGLTFVNGDREKKKMVLNFTSSKPQVDENETPVGDVLDEVYGSPAESKTKKKIKNKAAATIGELIKLSKDDLLKVLFNKVNEKE